MTDVVEGWVYFGSQSATYTFRPSLQTILMHIYYLIANNHGGLLVSMVDWRDTVIMSRGNSLDSYMQDPHCHGFAWVTLMKYFTLQRSTVFFLNSYHQC